MRLTAILILCLAPALARAAEPLAKIDGPSTAAIGVKLLYDVSGSASDPETPLRVKISGPASPEIQVWFDAKQKPGLVVFSPPAPGRYFIFVVATGKAEGAATPSIDFAPWVLEVGSAPPTPPTPPDPPPDPPPTPSGDYDPAFVPIGKAVAAQFAMDYAAAVEDGAKLLDAGQTRTAAYSTISKAFSANRQASFDRLAAVALDKVSPGSIPDNQLTPGQQKALARAIRGLAKGATGK